MRRVPNGTASMSGEISRSLLRLSTRVSSFKLRTAINITRLRDPPFKLEPGSITPEEEVDDDDSEHYAQATSSVVPNSRAHVISTAANEK